MSSHSVQIENNRVLLPVMVLDTAQPRPDSLSDKLFTALVDTGATHSMISEQVVQGLGLEAVGTDAFMPANGEPTSTQLSTASRWPCLWRRSLTRHVRVLTPGRSASEMAWSC